jgi:hypothetical protein
MLAARCCVSLINFVDTSVGRIGGGEAHASIYMFYQQITACTKITKEEGKFATMKNIESLSASNPEQPSGSLDRIVGKFLLG